MRGAKIMVFSVITSYLKIERTILLM